MRPGSKTLSLETTLAGAYLGPLPPRVAVGASRGREAAAPGRRRDDGDRDAARARRDRARADAGATSTDASFYDLLTNRYGDRDRGRHADDRADGDERGGVRGARRPAPLAGVPVRAHDACDRRPRSSSSSARSTAATGTGSSASSAATAPRRRPRSSRASGSTDGCGAGARGRASGAAPFSSRRSASSPTRCAASATAPTRSPRSRACARAATSSGSSAHGSSDNAASYGVYAFGLLPGWTALRDSISLSVYYGADIDFRRSAVVALSQSGRTPDVIEYVERARAPWRVHDRDHERGGIRRSPAAARAVLPLGVGVERAVAATKTYYDATRRARPARRPPRRGGSTRSRTASARRPTCSRAAAGARARGSRSSRSRSPSWAGCS